MNYQTKYKQIPIEVSIHLRYLHQDKGLTVPELSKRCKILIGSYTV